jgi:hypothetical protein
MPPSCGHKVTMTDPIVVPLRLDPADEGSVLEVPFEMPPGAESIEVQLNVPEQEGLVVDLGIADPDRLRGWSGSARRDILIAEHAATPGYLPGRIQPGSWRVLVGGYRIPVPAETVLHLHVTTVSASWRPVDLHAHSLHSDGALAVVELAKRAHREGLAALVLSDHNTASQNRERKIVADPAGPLLLAGMEWTSRRGHAGIIGVDDPISNPLVTDEASALRALSEARALGALVIANHPFDSFAPGLAWQWPWSWVDGIEVWNGPWRASSETALNWADRLAGLGWHHWIAGGSDFHREDPFVEIAHPTTWVYVTQPGEAGVLEGLRAGRTVLTRSARELAPLPMTTPPGLGTADTFVAAFRGTEEGDRLVIRDATGRETTVVAHDATVQGALKLAPGFRWARAELRRREPVFGTWLAIGLTSYAFEEVAG